MKKFARFLCVVLTAVLLCATLASCGGDPAATADDAVAALKKAGFVVTVENAEHELKAYAELGIAATCVIGAKEVGGEEVAYLYYFADGAAASAALEAVKTLAADAKAALAEGLEWVEPTVLGAMIYFGSVDGVAAAH